MRCKMLRVVDCSWLNERDAGWWATGAMGVMDGRWVVDGDGGWRAAGFAADFAHFLQTLSSSALPWFWLWLWLWLWFWFWLCFGSALAPFLGLILWGDSKASNMLALVRYKRLPKPMRYGTRSMATDISRCRGVANCSSRAEKGVTY